MIYQDFLDDLDQNVQKRKLIVLDFILFSWVLLQIFGVLFLLILFWLLSRRLRLLFDLLLFHLSDLCKDLLKSWHCAIENVDEYTYCIALIHVWVILVEFMVKDLLAINLFVDQHLHNEVFQESQIRQRWRIYGEIFGEEPLVLILEYQVDILNEALQGALVIVVVVFDIYLQ